jgi:hypothetical protein
MPHDGARSLSQWRAMFGCLSAQSRQRGWARQVAAIIGCEDRAEWLGALG